MSAQTIGPFSRQRDLLSLVEKEDSIPGVKNEPENETVRRAEAIWEEHRSYRDDDLHMPDRWRSNRAWYTAGSRSGSYRTYVNLPYEKITKMHADLTEADPTIAYRASRPEGVRMTDALNLAIPEIWAQNNGDALWRETMKATLVYGTDFWKIVHDPGYGGRGPKVRFYRVPCYRMFPAPYSDSIENASVVIEVQPRTVEEVFNDYRVKVEPELEPRDFPDLAEDLAAPGMSPVMGAGISSVEGVLTGNQVGNMFPSSFTLGRGKSQGIVFQKEMWIRDPALERKYFIERTKKGPRAAYGDDLMFPRGRCITWANGKLLYDDDNPYLDGQWPYLRFTDNRFPDFFWGLGEIPHIVNLQLLHDDTVESMRLIHAYMANPRTIIDKTTGLQDGEIGNDPNEIWWTNRGTQDRIKVHHGATPPAEFYTHVAQIENWADLIMGQGDVTRGENPPGVRAARAVAQLQRAATGRNRGRLREMEDTLKRGGKMLGSRYLQFSDGSIAHQDDAGQFQDFHLTEEDRTQEYDLNVDIISSLDDVRTAAFEQTMLFKELGLVSDERLIKESGHPATQAILSELPALQQAQLQAAMQKAAMAAQMGQAEEEASPRGAAQEVVGRRRDVTRATAQK